MTSEMSAAGRIYQWAGMFIVGVCLLLPLDTRFRKPHDDFPLSWYPMFASKRPDLETPVYAVAIWPDGHEAKITTGTWTDAHPVAAGETWSTAFAGVSLPGMTLSFV